jgi:hypothetical protein
MAPASPNKANKPLYPDAPHFIASSYTKRGCRQDE